VLVKTLDDAVAAASKEHVTRKVVLTRKGLQVCPAPVIQSDLSWSKHP
jgi:hypothetical protein